VQSIEYSAPGLKTTALCLTKRLDIHGVTEKVKVETYQVKQTATR